MEPMTVGHTAEAHCKYASSTRQEPQLAVEVWLDHFKKYFGEPEKNIKKLLQLAKQV